MNNANCVSPNINEVLYSDYRNAFVDSLIEQLNTENTISIKNLIFILVKNSWDSAINEALISITNKREEVCDAICQLHWINAPFQLTQKYMEILLDCLNKLEHQHDGINYANIIYKLISVILKRPLVRDIDLMDTPEISKVLDQFVDTKLFDKILTVLARAVLFPRRIRSKSIDILLSRYSSSVLDKLRKNLPAIESDFEGSSTTRTAYNFMDPYNVTYYFEVKNKKLRIQVFSQTLELLSNNIIQYNEISSFLKSLESSFLESNINNIEREIYLIFGPQVDSKIEDVSIFIKAYEVGILYDFFGWEAFPFINISINPSILSKIIVFFGDVYNRRIFREYEQKINIKDFNNKKICPPARLLAYNLLNKPYDKNLVDESIIYFRECSLREKKGAFSIVYKILYPYGIA